MTDLTAVSLFDGIGGFPEALRRAGIRTVATVEIDKAAAGVAGEHFPNAKHFSDVTRVSADDLRAAGFDPARGVLTGGWPCQDLSLAGRRLGLDGSRSGLFFEIVRLAAGLRPRWLILENVPGLLSAVCSCPGLGVCGAGCTDPHPVPGGSCGIRGRGKRRRGRCVEIHGGAMGAVLGALAELGYGLAYRVLDAQHFGVPQRRRRVVIVGCLGDWAAPAQVLLEPESGEGHPATGGAAWKGSPVGSPGVPEDTRRRVINALTTRGEAAQDDNAAQSGHVVVATLTVPAGGWRVDAESAAGNHLIATTVTAREGKGPDSDATTTLVGFDLAQITSGENRSRPEPGDPQPPLAATGQPHVAYALRANPGGVQGQPALAGTTPDDLIGGAGVSAAVRRLTPV